MQKFIFILMFFLMPLIYTSCSNSEPKVEDFRTRSVEQWYYEFDSAYDGFWEMVFESDAEAQLLKTTNWLPYQIKNQFIAALWEGGATVDNHYYPWEDTTYVVKEVLSWGGDNGNIPTKIRYTLWALEIGVVNGHEMFKYIVPETNKSYYTVEIDPYE